MRKFFFYLFIALLVAWTGWVFVVMGRSTPDPAEFEAMSEGAKAGAGLGIVFMLIVWAVIAVPLGIFALIAKPR